MLTRFWLDANARQATEPERPAISLLQWERLPSTTRGSLCGILRIEDNCKGNDILTVMQYYLVQGCVTPEPSRVPRVVSCTRETLNCSKRPEGYFSPSSSFLYGSEEVSTWYLRELTCSLITLWTWKETQFDSISKTYNFPGFGSHLHE